MKESLKILGFVLLVGLIVMGIILFPIMAFRILCIGFIAFMIGIILYMAYSLFMEWWSYR